MKRFATLLILGFILCSNVADAEVPLDEPNSWAFFAPLYNVTDAALLDLRFLNDHFSAWLLTKYGSTAEAWKTWGDGFKGGVIGAIHHPQNAKLLDCGIGRNEQTVGGTNCGCYRSDDAPSHQTAMLRKSLPAPNTA